jgi:uncharacterized protein
MMRAIFRPILLSTMIGFFTLLMIACNGQAIDPVQKAEAQRKLSELNIPYSEAAFIDHVKRNQHSVVKLFLDAGMSPETQMRVPDTVMPSIIVQSYPILFASAKGHIDIVTHLINAGADVNIRDQTDYNALDNAVGSNRARVVEILLQSGARIVDGYPLYRAAGNGRADIVESLIGAGSSTEKTDRNGKTALMNAVFDREVNVVKALINGGANVHAVDNFGNTPLSVAKLRNDKKTIDLLHKAGAR